MPSGSTNDQEKKDMVQVLAEQKYAKSNQEEGDEAGAEKLGPPNPENYKEAEEALNELLDDVQKKRYTVENFSRKAAVILGAAPMTLGLIITATIEASTLPAWKKAMGEKRPTFLEALHKEWKKGKDGVSQFWTPEYSAAGELKEIKKNAKKLKGARDSGDSKVSE